MYVNKTIFRKALFGRNEILSITMQMRYFKRDTFGICYLKQNINNKFIYLYERKWKLFSLKIEYF